jgi:hypothetical protein
MILAFWILLHGIITPYRHKALPAAVVGMFAHSFATLWYACQLSLIYVLFNGEIFITPAIA